ncbi:MAG: hypothetical protein QM784_06115 [Polyangiaceae bacterium]
MRTLKFMQEQGVLLALREEEGQVGKLAREAYHDLMNPKVLAGMKALENREEVDMDCTRLLRVPRVNAAMACAIAAFSCSGPNIVPSSSIAPPRTVITDPQRFASLGARCNASGIEICFDAVDQNCDGAVDEGCGVPDGALQLIAAWPIADADVDLEVIDPHGELASIVRSTSLGLVKDRDCPKAPDECGGQNVEVVYLDAVQVPAGRYVVTLRLKRARAPAVPVTVRLGGHIGSEAVSGSWTLTRDVPAAQFEILRIEPGAGR